MKKLRCTSCGAELKIEDNNEYAVCEHCGSKYKLNEDLNINIKVDDSVKEVINNGIEASKHFSLFLLIPVVLFVMIIIVGVFFAFKTYNDSKKSQDIFNEKFNDSREQFNEMVEKDSFNFQFNSAAGTKSGFLLKSTLDKVIKSNKTNSRQVTLVYNGNSTTNENEIIEIKHELVERDDYEVSVNYDDDGYVFEIVVKKIK